MHDNPEPWLLKAALAEDGMPVSAGGPPLRPLTRAGRTLDEIKPVLESALPRIAAIPGNGPAIAAAVRSLLAIADAAPQPAPALGR